eukprot:TRINITY_DN3258_c0_g1_i4.p1 TRINITY_DN3258_c0_g1~~TRINITY_DN3258_c0_g1_i4.p1  ORF type:complete len:250 (+),score=60.64 TRINITY_DN3258_c0_g1_i4:235-984(+)
MSSLHNTEKPQTPAKSLKKNAKTFGESVKDKQDVGEFASGYFIMPSTSPSPTPSIPAKDHKHKSPRSRSRQPSPPTPKSTPAPQALLATPLPASTSCPAKNDKSPSKKVTFVEPLKENYPNQACLKKLVSPYIPATQPLSPSSARWAGGAFTNAPPPSALPMPSFDDIPAATHSPAIYAKPSPWETLLQAVPVVYQHALVGYPPHIMPYAYPPAFAAPTTSTSAITDDIRRLLNISTYTPSIPLGLVPA